MKPPRPVEDGCDASVGRRDKQIIDHPREEIEVAYRNSREIPDDQRITRGHLLHCINREMEQTAMVYRSHLNAPGLPRQEWSLASPSAYDAELKKAGRSVGWCEADGKGAMYEAVNTSLWVARAVDYIARVVGLYTTAIYHFPLEIIWLPRKPTRASEQCVSYLFSAIQISSPIVRFGTVSFNRIG